MQCPEVSLRLPLWSRYLSRPSALTGPSSDLGSGERELQLVWLQGSRLGQTDGPVAHSPATDQKLPNVLSVQSSRAGPVSSECLRDASSACSGRGRFKIALRPWKVCSVYSLWGGPAWSQLPSSGVSIERIQNQYSPLHSIGPSQGQGLPSLVWGSGFPNSNLTPRWPLAP